MSNSLHLILTLPGAVALGSLWLIAWGWRGQRLDAHPVCRRCGFDLFGLPPGRRVCSECGNDLNRRRATRQGNRRRRWWAVVTGGVPLTLCLTWLAAVTWVWARDVDVNQYKPVWWLAREIDDINPATAATALTEVGNRLRAGTLTAQQGALLIDRALAAQRDLGRPWTGAWGDCIELVNQFGAVPAAKWDAYVRQAVASRLALEVRPQVRRGDPLPLRLAARTGRCGRTLAVTYDCDVFVGDTRVVPIRSRQHTLGIDTNVLVNASVYDRMPDGPNAVSVTITPLVQGINGRVKLPPLSLCGRFELTAGAATAVKLIHDDALEPDVRSAIRLGSLQRRGRLLIIEARFLRPKVSLGYQVFIRAGEDEWAGPRVAVMHDATGWLFDQVTVDGLTAHRVDVVFRPSLEAAAATVDVTEIWDGEIVLSDIPVR